MLGIGENELLIIVVFAFLLFGPDKLPQMGRTIGRALRQFRTTQEKMTAVVQSEVIDPMQSTLNAPVRPKKPASRAQAPADADDLDADIEGDAPARPVRKETFAERRARLAAEKAAAEKDAAAGEAPADGAAATVAETVLAEGAAPDAASEAAASASGTGFSVADGASGDAAAASVPASEPTAPATAEPSGSAAAAAPGSAAAAPASASDEAGAEPRRRTAADLYARRPKKSAGSADGETRKEDAE